MLADIKSDIIAAAKDQHSREGDITISSAYKA